MAGIAVCVLVPLLALAFFGLVIYAAILLLPKPTRLLDVLGSTTFYVLFLLCFPIFFLISPMFAGYLAAAFWDKFDFTKGEKTQFLFIGSLLTVFGPILFLNVTQPNERFLFESIFYGFFALLIYFGLLEAGASLYKRGSLNYFLGKTPYKPGEEPPQTKSEEK